MKCFSKIKRLLHKKFIDTNRKVRRQDTTDVCYYNLGYNNRTSKNLFYAKEDSKESRFG